MRFSISVVLPEPRKPVMMVMGIGGSDMLLQQRGIFLWFGDCEMFEDWIGLAMLQCLFGRGDFS